MHLLEERYHIEDELLDAISHGNSARALSFMPKIYDGEKAVKDTAYEVRRARNQGIFVIGIFAGNEEELSVEKRIYGKDFAYIRNISNFSRMVGTFLRRQIDME